MLGWLAAAAVRVDPATGRPWPGHPRQALEHDAAELGKAAAAPFLCPPLQTTQPAVLDHQACRLACILGDGEGVITQEGQCIGSARLSTAR
jgi:hypothetical protein